MSAAFDESKTEFVHFFKAEKDQVDGENKAVRGTLSQDKIPGLLYIICSEYDISLKYTLGNFAFKNYNDVWLQGKIIGLAVLIKVYEAMVTSVMMYNCSSWAATKDVLKKLHVCHRKHL